MLLLKGNNHNTIHYGEMSYYNAISHQADSHNRTIAIFICSKAETKLTKPLFILLWDNTKHVKPYYS